jgi:hypothetical protein
MVEVYDRVVGAYNRSMRRYADVGFLVPCGKLK